MLTTRIIEYRIDAVVVILLFLTALLVRFYRIEDVTPGAWGDEITIGEVGEKLIDTGKIIPFIEDGLGHPTPLLYLGGYFTKSFGRSLLTIRLVSVIFGALSIIAFYFLLRQVFSKVIASTVSLLFSFSYPHLVVSRLAYEVTASLFVQILTIIFLFIALRTAKTIFYFLLGATLGLGLYTYLGFRTFLIFILIYVMSVYIESGHLRRNVKQLFVLVAGLILISTPLIHYAISNWPVLLARTNSLSVFGQHLKNDEVIKEIIASVVRLQLIFAGGDPNPRFNPSGVGLVDSSIIFMGIIGFFHLIRKKKFSILLLGFLITSSAVANDIFSLERIPEFHYYGIGHPNTLRIFGILLPIYSLSAYGLLELHERLSRRIYFFITILLLSFSLVTNFTNYFSQREKNNRYYSYNFVFNGGLAAEAVNRINELNFMQVAVSPEIKDDIRFNFLINNQISIVEFNPKTKEDALKSLKSSPLTIVILNQDSPIGSYIYSWWKSDDNLNHLSPITDPFGKVVALTIPGRP